MTDQKTTTIEAHRFICEDERYLNYKIGLLIRRARRTRGLTQIDLGQLIGVRFQQIQKYETGHRCTLYRLKRIAKALNHPINYFISEG